MLITALAFAAALGETAPVVPIPPPIPTSAITLMQTFETFCLEDEIVPAAILAKVDAAGWKPSPISIGGDPDPTGSRRKVLPDGRSMILSVTGEASAAHPGQAACGVGLKPGLKGAVAEARARYGLKPISPGATATNFFLTKDAGVWRSVGPELGRDAFLAAARAGRFRSMVAFDSADGSVIVGLIDRSPPSQRPPHP